MIDPAVTQLRLRLLANGYSPIRSLDKRTFMAGWPHAKIDEAEIRRWGRMRRDKATGIRVEDGLAVIDFDIDDAALMLRIGDAVLDAIPVLADLKVPLLVRRGKGAKVAWFVGTEEAFSRIHSRAWLKPGTTVDDGAHRVEIFGGASPRQFGSFGYHTAPEHGKEAIFYRWEGRSPLDTPLSQLPVLTKKQFFEIADIVEATLEAAGWTVVLKTTRGENKTSWVYDLTEDMVFQCDDGIDRKLRELVGGLRCSASFTGDKSAKRRDRCQIAVTREGRVVVTDHDGDVKHAEKPDTQLMKNVSAKLARLIEVTRR
ncbi:bifunctional DNA primase/polymerase [Mesorhizobium sp. M1405]|uniref:bifunctional DNA primase/polymerase n=1 Tax=Mesorhizobium sp. M1405 TaxID=2957098 RepID=UPI00333CEEED